MNTSGETQSEPAAVPEGQEDVVLPLPPANSGVMEEYYQLQHELYLWTLGMSVVAFGSVWYFYSLETALSYAVGSCVGIVYLRLLAKKVEGLGRKKQRLSQAGLAVFIGVMILAIEWEQLEIVPVFLGFLTYKVSIIAYMLRTTLA
ncbi:ATP synthase subunit I [Roseofilum casamattae]|uniref:ATP synthase subunit I n=1 Tax=Roseofilum casamattae BLCC-M143 TaxID=3022442 RepID=A0ABT7C2M5_9CYAN|nr:ATP synthase subunit I [Roseofilum casamattae]MDJ1185699.1 ATP synthase subunit I [Roseofilum casamattae BLCC-M143]